MPEINLAIGRYQGTAGDIQQELLGWFDTQGKRYLILEEKVERLAARLWELGEAPTRFNTLWLATTNAPPLPQ